MNIRSNTINAVFWSAIQGWGGHLIGFSVYLLLARLLGPKDFGLIALAFVFIAFTQVFVEQGLSAAIIQKKDLDDSHLSTAFWSNAVAGLLLMFLAYALSGLISEFYKEPELEPIIKWLSILLFVNSLSGVQSAILRKSLRFKAIAIRTISGLVVGAIVGVSMALNNYGVYSLVGQQLCSASVQFIMIWLVSNWRPSFTFSIRRFKELYAYGLNVLGINLLEFVNRYSDNLLIGYYLGPVMLGYYSIAYRLYQTITQLLTGLSSQVLFSSFSLLQNDIKKLRQAFYSVVGLTSIFAFPVFIILLVLAKDVVTIAFGEKWDISVPVFQVLMIVAIIESVYFYNGSLMMAMGKPSWRLKLNCVNAVVNVIGFFIAVQYGIIYVAIAYTLRTYLLSPLPLICVRKLIQIDFWEYFSVVGFSLVLCLIAGGALYFLRWELLGNYVLSLFPMLLVFIFIGVSMVIYFLLIMKYRVSLFKEITRVFSSLTNKYYA